ncbi:uncharacterized protein LY89DRAFT_22533 [Mollisia scopiformis]|uniref:Uncharacterized protein n=1 Tax=Mollisia scopiformis TaxID=149040 RepID=A0A194XWM7_MOLSC|nr:uncharacterized protein LY89DRAFT_22533 [Mollisia scopiformis]KUJ24424.1 hypothetical protein LY89DRAFT_22533 [Mollisia scopiformis]
MDPFSVTVGAIALAETANKLASSLTDRYSAFSSAPKEMLEIASHVTMCAGLVNVFAQSIDDRSEDDFPKSFRQDASFLVLQKPDYGDRLKWAFGSHSQKKVAKHQENLKQAQHMIMFMTTCWQFKLPSKPKQPSVGTTGSSIPMGSLQGVLQHMPVQINMKGPESESQTVTYEATLTLKPVEQRPQREEYELEHARKKIEVSSRSSETTNRAKQALENMRRSPYFSMLLLQPKLERVVQERKYYRAEPASEDEREKMKMEEEKRKQEAEMELEMNFRPKPLSKEAASEDVEDILSQWFDEDPEPDYLDHDHDSLSDLEEVTSEVDPPPLSKGGLKVETPLRPSSAPMPEHPNWDWACDGCERKVSALG